MVKLNPIILGSYYKPLSMMSTLVSSPSHNGIRMENNNNSSFEAEDGNTNDSESYMDSSTNGVKQEVGTLYQPYFFLAPIPIFQWEWYPQ